MIPVLEAVSAPTLLWAAGWESAGTGGRNGMVRQAGRACSSKTSYKLSSAQRCVKAVHEQTAFARAAADWAEHTKAGSAVGLDVLSRCKRINEFLNKVCIINGVCMQC
jgi:hypothetical protein